MREQILKKLKLSDNMLEHRSSIRMIDATIEEFNDRKCSSCTYLVKNNMSEPVCMCETSYAYYIADKDIDTYYCSEFETK